MRFWEAMKVLEEGGKIRATHWDRQGWMDVNSAEALLPLSLKVLMQYEWEEVNDVPLMDLYEVMNRIKEGEKYKRIGWPAHLYFEMEAGFVFSTTRGLTPEDFLAEDYHKL